MSSKITIDELEKYLWGSAVLLRTHVDAGAYKQYIFPLLRLSQMDTRRRLLYMIVSAVLCTRKN